MDCIRSRVVMSTKSGIHALILDTDSNYCCDVISSQRKDANVNTDIAVK